MAPLDRSNVPFASLGPSLPFSCRLAYSLGLYNAVHAIMQMFQLLDQLLADEIFHDKY